MRRSQLLAACLLGVLSAAPRAAQAPPLPPSCGPIGDLRFVCGPDGAEDLVAVPRTPWLIASAIAGNGGIYAVDTAKATSIKVFPSATAAERLTPRPTRRAPGRSKARTAPPSARTGCI